MPISPAVLHAGYTPGPRAQIPAPEPGVPWRRMTRSQRSAAVREAVEEGRSPHSLAADHSVQQGTQDWRLLRVMMSSRQGRAEEAQRRLLPPPVPRLTIDQLSDSVCRWPLWPQHTEERLYCGAPRDTTYTGPYCPTCRARALRPGHFVMR